jgi:serpin B
MRRTIRLLALAALCTACTLPTPPASSTTSYNPPSQPVQAPSGSVTAPSPPPFPEELKVLAVSNNAFGLDLFGKLRVEKGNLAISPLCLSMALTMTWAGARGETAREMQKVLHLDGTIDQVPALAGKLLHGYQDPALGVTLRLADRLFGEKTARLRPAFTDRMSASFGAPVEPVDFLNAADASRQHINAWVAEATADRIKDLIPPGGVDRSTQLVLVNAIYFLGTWRSPFFRQATAAVAFHLTPSESHDVPTMRQDMWVSFAATDGVKLLELPYRGGAFAMTLVLPDAVDGLGAVEAQLSPATLERWLVTLASATVSVVLPKFEIDPPALMLNEPLRSLGMMLAFDGRKADFGGLAEEPSHVSGIFHKAFVKLDEQGTEAAAATTIREGKKARPEPPKLEFHADHPFLFFLRDVRSGLILFMGRVADPTVG